MKTKALRIKAGTRKEEEVDVSDESLFHIFVDKQHIVSLFASPRYLEELTVGFLASEGIADYTDVSSIKVQSCEIWVETKNRKKLNLSTELRSSGCSGIMQADPAAVKSKQTFKVDTILNSLKYLDESSVEWKKSGGTHAAALISSDGKFLTAFEDIGRHNAIDKSVGWALINGHTLDDKYILFTGRLSTGVVTKVARVGMPLIVSNTAPLSRAIDTAEKLNVTLIGFARGADFTVYCVKDRIID